VTAKGGKPIEEVAGIPLDNLTLFDTYTLVGDGELNVPALRIRISDRKLYDRLAAADVLEVEGAPAEKYDPKTDYTLRLDHLPLVPPFTASVNLDGVFEQLAELKVLSSLCAAHVAEEPAPWTPAQVEELKRHYLSKNLFLNFPTTTEYTDRDKALMEGLIDTRTSYKMDIGSRTILNLGKFPPANKFLDRMYEVLDATGRRINKPTCEDCLGNVAIRHKELSPRTRITPVDEFMRRLFDDFLGVAPNGSATAVLKRVGAGELPRMIADRGRGKQPDRTAFVSALINARKALDAASDAVFNDRVSPLVFYIGSTGTLPDEIEAKALTAEQITAKYPELNLSRDEQDGLFFEIGEAIVSVYARTEFFTRERTVPAKA
jgi:hypothetical protein